MKKERSTGQQVSRTDPDAGYMVRDGKPKGFFYLDHRTVDGATASEFLRTVKLFLKQPVSRKIVLEATNAPDDVGWKMSAHGMGVAMSSEEGPFGPGFRLWPVDENSSRYLRSTSVL